MRKSITGKRKVKGIYMLMELSLICCITLMVYSCVNWTAVGTQVNSLIQSILTYPGTQGGGPAES